jgi:threonine/homoserine/homoserine lactone efflux protein
MNWELYAAFCAATAVLTLIPGPMVGVITGTGIRFGVRAALLAVAGGVTAMTIHMVIIVVATASMSLFLATWMPLLRWVGVAYLCYLGAAAFLRSFRAEPGETPPEPRRSALFARGLVVNVSNPKPLAFIAAFFPQFIDASLPIGPQVLIMGVSYVAIGGTLDAGWALVSGKARWLFESDRARRWKERVAGTALIGGAAGLASARTH